MSNCIGVLKHWLDSLNGEDEPDAFQGITDCVEQIPQILLSDNKNEASERFKAAIRNICRNHPDNSYAAICTEIIDCRITGPEEIVNLNLKSWPLYYLMEICHMVLKSKPDSVRKTITLASLYFAGQSNSGPPRGIEDFSIFSRELAEGFLKDIRYYLLKVSNNSREFKQVLEFWKNADINEETAKVRDEIFSSRGEYCFNPEMVKVNMPGGTS